MSELIDHLARLTRLRDGDVLDVMLAGLTRELLQCQAIAIHRLVADGSTRRWLTTARASADGSAPLGVSTSPTHQLPDLDDRPQWRDCLLESRTHELPGDQHTSLHPLTATDETVGVMEITSMPPPGDVQQRMTSSLLGFYRQLRGLIDENERDSLTGLLNRKTFDETFVRATNDVATLVDDPAEIDGNRRDESAALQGWLAMVDIDHFKRVNDTHGHLIGDEVLLLVAQQMRGSFRYCDRLYRFGGEEFVVLLRCPSGDEAMQAFERLRANIEAFAFPQVGRLTVSVGYTAINADDMPSTALERADQAVYFAKENGRNLAVNYADLAVVEDSGAVRGGIEMF